MAVIYTSRTGKTYCLLVKADKRGRSRYYFSTKSEGHRAQSIPDGYETHENVHGVFFLRKKVPRVIADDEIGLIESGLREHADEWRYKAEIKKNAIIIHEVCQDFDGLRELLPWLRSSSSDEFELRHATYMPVMRFVLEDKATRIFCPERMCFRGEGDRWIWIGPPGTLADVASKYIKHLGEDSFFDLF